MADVLVVDDHPAVCKAVMALLQMYGHRPTCENSGVGALRAIRSSPPSLVILDLMMPGMSGLEVLQSIRSDASIRDTPVVMYSASPDLEAKQQALDLGAAAWLVKTEIVPDQLAKLVSRYDDHSGH